jgi:molecular chaperone Hsp33
LNEVQTFLLEDAGVRGALVRLTETWRNATAQHHYPSPVQYLLGESLAAAVLLTTGLKGAPSLSLQLQSDGPVKLLLSQCSAELRLRGLAQWRSNDTGLPLLGRGRLTVNLGSADGRGLVQGIVPLVADRLETCLETYFLQSEQLPTRLILQCTEEHSSGLLVQLIPGRGATQESFERVGELAAAVSREALHGRTAEQLLPEIFRGHSVRLFAARNVGYDCRCTPSYLADILRILGPDELHSILSEQGHIELTCDFCNRAFLFQPADIDAVLRGGEPTTVVH